MMAIDETTWMSVCVYGIRVQYMSTFNRCIITQCMVIVSKTDNIYNMCQQLITHFGSGSILTIIHTTS